MNEEIPKEFHDAIINANPAVFPTSEETTQAFEEIRLKEAGKGHSWKQRGPHLVCTSCRYEHSVYIGMDKVMVGYDKGGNPELKNRW